MQYILNENALFHVTGLETRVELETYHGFNDHTFKVLTIRMTLWSEFSKEEYNNLSPGISLTMQTFLLLLIAN